jgi:hypothetical protein
MTEKQFNNLPEQIRKFLNQNDEETYENCKMIQDTLNRVGWDCSWGLSGCIDNVWETNLLVQHRHGIPFVCVNNGEYLSVKSCDVIDSDAVVLTDKYGYRYKRVFPNIDTKTFKFEQL